MKIVKCAVIGLACLGFSGLPMGCGDAPEVTVDADDEGTSEEAMDEMEEIGDTGGIEE